MSIEFNIPEVMKALRDLPPLERLPQITRLIDDINQMVSQELAGMRREAVREAKESLMQENPNLRVIDILHVISDKTQTSPQTIQRLLTEARSYGVGGD